MVNTALQKLLENTIRDVPDFPKPGILFKDITPILKNPELCKLIIEDIGQTFTSEKPEAIIGIESRGFLFGILLANYFNIPFIPIRKAGKLPYKTIRHQYSLEYGNAEMEMHEDALEKGMRVLVHDDLLATGGTALAAASLINLQQAHLIGFSFLVELKFLHGRNNLEKFSQQIHSLIQY
jgi:adenine phosphoribosyltransferase